MTSGETEKKKVNRHDAPSFRDKKKKRAKWESSQWIGRKASSKKMRERQSSWIIKSWMPSVFTDCAEISRETATQMRVWNTSRLVVTRQTAFQETNRRSTIQRIYSRPCIAKRVSHDDYFPGHDVSSIVSLYLVFCPTAHVR